MKRLPRMIFATLFMAGFIYYYANSRLGGSVVKLEQAIAAFQKDDIQGALKIIEGEPGQYVELENGCELTISVFAKAQRPKMLEAIALKCLNQNKAVGIAHEGYAKALVDQDRLDEAIGFMEKEVKLQEVNARVYGALANLYQLKEDMPKAGEAYISAVKIAADGWTIWMGISLKREALASDKNFLQKMAQAVAEKTTPLEVAEKTLLQALEKQGMIAEVDLLKKRYE